MTKGQREYYLREQIKQIQRELGEADMGSEDLQAVRERLLAIKLPKQANEEAFKQLKRLERMSPESSEYALLRTYLEWMTDLPWHAKTTDKLDLKKAKAILDEDHFGLDKVKDRILEYLSVRALNPDSKGPILCFVGPPGVGKTSLGKSIARYSCPLSFLLNLSHVSPSMRATVQGFKQLGRYSLGLSRISLRQLCCPCDDCRLPKCFQHTYRAAVPINFHVVVILH
jgi:SpoVK/Ycf46/Vps4 family AAA+-type ATPase